MKSFRAKLLLAIFFLAASLAWDPAAKADLAAAAQLAAVVVGEHPHDPGAFTQGLAWDNGMVYESTGLHGRSSLRRVELASGRIEQQLNYGWQIFAEGATVFRDSIYQLTWTNNIVFQYDKRTLALRRTLPWPREGWGIAHDNSSLIVSDGTSVLYFLDPDTMAERRRLVVYDNGRPLERLNELEWVKGSIYANVWQQPRIAVINPESGAVTAWIELAELCRRMQAGPDGVLNGIMHDPAGDRLFVTGKLWPSLFEIRTVPVSPSLP